jgi:tRNA(Ile)-lysidine synthetase-like protein
LLHSYSNDFSGLVALADHQISRFSLGNRGLALGVSGGADSIGLFHVFCQLLKQKKIFDLVVFHINFGLRGDESVGDESFVRDTCQREGIKFEPFEAANVGSVPPETGIQEWARNIRRQIQRDYISRGMVIALAHNSDDVAENVLMRLARGADLETAAGMSGFEHGIFRPFLSVSRAHIRSCLRDSGKTWREDSSNAHDDYTRNKIRHHVMARLEELYPGASARISSAFIQRYSAHTVDDQAIDTVSIDSLRAVCMESVRDKIHDMISRHYGGQCPVSRQVIDQIAMAALRALSGSTGERKVFHLAGNQTLQISSADVRFITQE